MPIAASDRPALLLYRYVRGVPLSWERASRLSAATRPACALELVKALAALHSPAVLRAVRRAGLRRTGPRAQSTPENLVRRIARWVDPERRDWVAAAAAWCERRLDPESDVTFLHGDFHGWNFVMSQDLSQLRALVDFEHWTVGDPSFDFRYLPWQEPSLDLLFAVLAGYETATGRRIDIDRVMAWNTLTNLGDAAWRAEGGFEVVDGPVWHRVDGARRRLAEAGVTLDG
jgi:aminoglycoside phosphotransferase (APT) family kinase protein